jgi:hypothetical protein
MPYSIVKQKRELAVRIALPRGVTLRIRELFLVSLTVYLT